MKKKAKIIFMGTPEFAVPALKALHKSNQNLALVVTRPDRPKGRGRKVTPPPVKEVAINLGYEVDQPKSVGTAEFENRIAKYKPDIIVVVAFGHIIPKNILEIPKIVTINIHASLLPKYRGPAPIQWQGSAAGFHASGLRGDFAGARGIVCPDCDDEERFDVLEIDGDVVVVDLCTGLMWQQVPDDREFTFEDAADYCDDLALAGESDWRMPTLRELLEIVDYDRWNPAISWLFRGASARYWVDEPFAYDPGDMHWAVDFLYGEVAFASPRSEYLVRAVRDIQEGDLD